VAAPDGSECVRGEREGGAGEAEAIGLGLAEDLLAAGAARLLGGET
jgi:hydroxymethylbilane synthase